MSKTMLPPSLTLWPFRFTPAEVGRYPGLLRAVQPAVRERTENLLGGFEGGHIESKNLKVLIGDGLVLAVFFSRTESESIHVNHAIWCVNEKDSLFTAGTLSAEWVETTPDEMVSALKAGLEELNQQGVQSGDDDPHFTMVKQLFVPLFQNLTVSSSPGNQRRGVDLLGLLGA